AREFPQCRFCHVFCFGRVINQNWRIRDTPSPSILSCPNGQSGTSSGFSLANRRFSDQAQFSKNRKRATRRCQKLRLADLIYFWLQVLKKERAQVLPKASPGLPFPISPGLLRPFPHSTEHRLFIWESHGTGRRCWNLPASRASHRDLAPHRGCDG